MLRWGRHLGLSRAKWQGRAWWGRLHREEL